ncbi:hypothetical protein PR202_ga11672 [Eleusine coracana subsp. coracana]|uniref:Protein kinase domain-containing protein n=1 Tax=Eleusine coracana subsp. coracana TaxID=191504 RepID=A0AAV5CA48_ELECO|nr:hypothetical protein PR202_ga11672 [Eleusine coracana subsp. coracana]
MSGGDEDDDSTVPTVPPLPREGVYIFTKSEVTQATKGYDKKLLLGTDKKLLLDRLPSGQRVAIKRIYRSNKVSKVNALAKLRHRNLAALLGYCRLSADDNHHALVYEYMPGGSLHHAPALPMLTWRRCLEEVAVDVARGLAYLHARRQTHQRPALGHRHRAKLSDFGVSHVIGASSYGEGTHVSTEVCGYVDPESFSAGHVSEAADVYSFGVVLLELAMADPRLGPPEERDGPSSRDAACDPTTKSTSARRSTRCSPCSRQRSLTTTHVSSTCLRLITETTNRRYRFPATMMTPGSSEDDGTFAASSSAGNSLDPASLQSTSSSSTVNTEVLP